MLRKLILATAALATVGIGSLVPAPASAGWHGGWHHGHWGHHRWHRHVYFAGPAFAAPVYAGYDSCLRKRWVSTPYGARLRWVNICY